MVGMTRATTTLLAAGVAGLLIWVATRVSDSSTGGFWAVYGLIAGAGLVMALSQLLGGWTKWGMPRLSAGVFLLAFIPVAIAGLWVVAAMQPHDNWIRSHVLAWSGDIHVRGVVTDLKEYISVIAFGIGLVFGFSFDTTGRMAPRRGTAVPAAAPGPVDRRATDEPLTADRQAQPARFGSRDGNKTPTATRTTNRT
jgi:hypothetical protein